MPNHRLSDAREVLPKKLLSKLQKYCMGIVYVPSPISRDGRAAILGLHKAGYSADAIARAKGVSLRWVRQVISAPDSAERTRRVLKLYQTVPADLVRQIQEHVVGRLYVPRRQKKKAGRNKRIERLFDEGLSVAEISKRTGLSQRQVYRIKKVWSEKAWLREMGSAKKPQVTIQQIPEYPVMKQCRGCHRPVVTNGEYCEVCKRIVGISDGEVYVPKSFPFAALDDNF